MPSFLGIVFHEERIVPKKTSQFTPASYLLKCEKRKLKQYSDCIEIEKTCKQWDIYRAVYSYLIYKRMLVYFVLAATLALFVMHMITACLHPSMKPIDIIMYNISRLLQNKTVVSPGSISWCNAVCNYWTYLRCPRDEPGFHAVEES